MDSVKENEIHWQDVFRNKDSSKVSWFEDKPQMSLDLIAQHSATKSSAIIDVGGGDSRVPDFLIKDGFDNVSILDISETALKASKKRLGLKADQAHWIVSDVLDFDAESKYDLWHDRAVFHFILKEENQLAYKIKLMRNLADDGYVIIASMSSSGGAEKCSGLNIMQHNRESILKVFSPEFEIVNDFEAMHITPSMSQQNFYWSVLKKNKSCNQDNGMTSSE